MSGMWSEVQRIGGVQAAQEGLLQALRRVAPLGPNDVPMHIADTIVVPAQSVVRITFTLVKGYVHFVRQLYVDAAPECTYKWVIDNEWRFGGNSHDLALPLKIQRTYQIILIIENEGDSDEALDYVIDGWSRPQGGGR